MSATVLPLHRLLARDLLFRATVDNGLSEWPTTATNTFVDAASLALAQGSVICLRRVGSVITYRVWGQNAEVSHEL